jgi:type II secretion system protein D
VRLNFKAASWSKVLKRVARHGGMEVVMRSTPPGTFTHNEGEDHTIPDALRIVNRQLEQVGYRAVQQGSFLVVLNLDGLRSRYNSPSVVRYQHDAVQQGAPAAANTPAVVSPSGAMQVSATDSEPNALAPGAIELNPDGNHGPGAAEQTREVANPADSVHLAGESQARAKEPEPEPLDVKIELADTTPQIRIFYVSAKWQQVLQSVAEQSGLTLVMKKCPSGTVKYREWKKHTTSDILAILNRELEESQSNFRLERQDKFLIVVDKEDLRSEYERPLVGNLRRPVHSEVDEINPRPSAVPVQQRPTSEVVPAAASAAVGNNDDAPDLPAAPLREPARLQPAPAAAEQLAAPPVSASPAEETPVPASAEPAPVGSGSGSVFAPQHRRAEAMARRLYAALKDRSQLVDSGPLSLPSFRVLEAPGAYSRIAFSVGIDTEHNRLIVDAPARKRSAVLRVFGRLDHPDSDGDDSVRLVSASATRTAIAKNVASQLNPLVAQNNQGNPPVPERAPIAPGRATLELGQGANPIAQPGQQNLSELIKGLKGEVTVESVPELGILILRGNPTDVDAVMKVIREIERLSAGAAPQINILTLQFVNSDSFATLMNRVYQDLHGLRSTEAGAGTAAKQPIHFYAIGKPNAVLVIAPPAEMPGVMKLAAQLDRPVVADTEFQVFPIRHGYAAQIAKSVSDFYKGRTGLGTVVMVVPDARTNSVIVQARPRDLDEVAKLIMRLDGPTASQATVKVFTLVNGDAATIVRLLDQLFVAPGQRSGAGAQVPVSDSGDTPPTTLRLTADVRTNSIVAVGAPETLQAIYAVILRLDNMDAHQRQTVVIKLKNNSSDAVQRAINDFVRSERDVAQIDPDLVSTVELLEREVFIISEPVSNSLLLSATPRYFEELKKMIDKLDAPPTQVVIQAMLVEVTLTNDDEFGIELGFQSPVLFDRSTLSPPVTLQTTTTQNTNTTVANNIALSTTAAPGFQFTDPNLGTDGLGTNSIVNTGTVGTQQLTNFGVGRTSNINPAYGSGLVLAASSESVSFLLRALSYKETLHVLSRPMIRTVDNQVATVQVGKNVPIIYGFTTTATGSLAPIVRYDGAGIILTVQPRITPDGMIVMHAAAEKSQYESGGVVLVTDSTTGRNISSPVKDVTRAEATVSLASGETVVMGGLITSSDDTVERKVPWIADVPLLGQLFRYDTKTTVRTELLIFLTPRVIRTDSDDEILKQIETERLHFLLDEAESIHGPILSNKPTDGLLQECPPLTMPQGLPPGAVPLGPSVVPPAPGDTGAPPVPMMRPSQQQGMPPELPPVMAPGVAPSGPGGSPVKPGIAPPIPRETYLDDPSVPTTRMPSAVEQNVRPLRAPTPQGQPIGQQAKPADRPGTVRFASQEDSIWSTAEPAAKSQ